MATMRPRGPTRVRAYWLQPPGAAPRSRHTVPGFSSRLPLVDLLELEDRPRAPALALGALHVGVAEVLLQPPIAALGSLRHPPRHSFYNERMKKRASPRARVRARTTGTAAAGPAASPAAGSAAAPPELSERQRRHLRGLAHHSNPWCAWCRRPHGGGGARDRAGAAAPRAHQGQGPGWRSRGTRCTARRARRPNRERPRAPHRQRRRALPAAPRAAAHPDP